jgi:hypothetical protein
VVDGALAGLAEQERAVVGLDQDVVRAQAAQQRRELCLGDRGERAARSAQGTVGGRRRHAAVLRDG